MDPLEADLLIIYGYIPANVQACRDFTDKKITSQELWRIINRNIDLSKYLDPLTHIKSEPRKGDLVRKEDDDDVYLYGTISWINRQMDTVNVYWFKASESEAYKLDDFKNYESKGGRTTWNLDY